jgi:hypothetical protein
MSYESAMSKLTITAEFEYNETINRDSEWFTNKILFGDGLTFISWYLPDEISIAKVISVNVNGVNYDRPIN